VQELADFLTGAGSDVVIVYGERLLAGPGGPQAARALLNLASRLELSGRDGAGLLEAPSSTNARGLREAGFAPHHGAGYAALAEAGTDARGIAEGLANGALSTVWLHHADPLRSHPDRPLWESALGTAQTVIAVDSVLTDTIREHADVVFPAEAYAEKEGTVTHPDGRVQRLRPAIGRPRGADGQSGSGVRPLWQVIADVAAATGMDLGVRTGPMASQQLFDAVPFYAGLTLDAIGGRGVRWPASEAAAALDAGTWKPVSLEVPSAVPSAGEGALRLGTFRSLWSSKEVDVSPSLRFLRPRQVVELSPTDAERLGIIEGDQVEVGSNGTRVTGAVKLRAAVPGGSVFIAEGTHEQPANSLTDAMVEVRKV
jgi:NADH-quinone oxidoreductase subunit G